MYLPPEHPIMFFETKEIKMAAVSAKKSVHTGFHSVTKEVRWLLIKSDVSGPLFGSDESISLIRLSFIPVY